MSEIADLTIKVDTVESVRQTEALKVSMLAAEHGADSWQVANARLIGSHKVMAAETAKSTAETTNNSKSIQKLESDVAKYLSTQDKVAKAVADYTKAEQLLNTALKEGVLSQVAYNDAMRLANSAYDAATGNVMKNAGAIAALGLNTQIARREITMIGKDLVEGDFSRAGRSFGTLVAHSNLLAAALSPIGLIIIGIGVAAGVFGYMAYSAEKLNQAIASMQTQMTATARAGVFTNDQFNVMIQTLERMPGSSREAAEKIVSEFTKNGGIGHRMIQPLLDLVPSFAAAIGEDMPAAAKKLAKSFEDPAQGVINLDKEMNFLTLTQLKQIETMKQHGDSAGIAELGMKALQDRVQGLNQTALTPMEKALHDLSTAWKGAMSALSENTVLVSVVSWMANLVSSTRNLSDNFLHMVMTMRQGSTGMTPEQQGAAGYSMPKGYGQQTNPNAGIDAEVAETDARLAKIEADSLEKRRQAKEKWLAEGLAQERKYNADMEALRQAALDSATTVNDEFLRKYGMLNKLFADGKLAVGPYTEEMKKLWSATALGKNAIKEESDAVKIQIELAKESNREFDKALAKEDEANKIRNVATRALELHVLTLELEVKTMGQSNDFKKIAIQIMKDEKAGIDVNTTGYKDMIDRIRAADDALKDFQETSKLWDSISSKAGQFFSDIIVGGKSAFGQLKSMLKSFAADAVAFFSKTLILNFVAGGSLGGSAANAASGALSNMASSGLGTTVGGLGTIANTVTGGFIGGIQAGLIGSPYAGAGVLSGAGSAIGEGLAAIGPVGWIALAAIAAYAVFAQKKGGDKNSGAGSYSAGSDGVVTSNALNDSNRFYRADNHGLDSMISPIVESTAKSFATYAKLFGIAAVATFVQSMDTDPQGKAPNRVATQALLNGKLVFQQNNQDLGRDDKAVQPELQLQAERALIAAIKAGLVDSGLENEMTKLFAGVAADTLDQAGYDTLIAKAVDLQSVIDALAKTDVPGLTIDSLKALQLAGESLGQTFMRVAGEFLQAQANLTAAIGARNPVFARQTALDSRNTIAQAFADSLGLHFGDDLLQRMALNPESFQHLSTAQMQLLTSFLGFQTTLEGLDTQLGALGNTVTTTTAAITAGYHLELTTLANGMQAWATIPNVVAGVVSSLTAARDNLTKYLQSLSISSLSPLSPQQKLDEARRQYEKMLADARAGNVNAISGLSGSANTYLTLAQQMYASSSMYNEIFRTVYESLGQIASPGATSWQDLFSTALPVNSPMASQADIVSLGDSVRLLIDTISNGISTHDKEGINAVLAVKVSIDKLSTKQGALTGS